MPQTMRSVFLVGIWLGFMALSAWATWEVGYLGIFEVAWSGPGGSQVFADLCIALGLASRWVYRDARASGRNPWPWLLAVPPLGSIPLITYAVWTRVVAPQAVPHLANA